MKFSFLPQMPRPMRITLSVLDYIARLLFLFFAVYAIIFSLLVPYGVYKVYSYGVEILDEVEILKNYNPPMSKFMESLQENSRRAIIKHTFIPLKSISPHLKKAVLAAEDAAFYYHPGFDVKAIANAMDANRQRGKTVFGGSTITQQIAKNMFLSNERSWERKVQELIYALLLEKYLGKDRILELYLNYAQWGKDIFGCEAAAQEYYKISCSDLSLEASINMAAVLASPGNHRPNNPTGRFMAKRRAVINFNMFGHHFMKDSSNGDSSAEEPNSLVTNSTEKKKDFLAADSTMQKKKEEVNSVDTEKADAEEVKEDVKEEEEEEEVEVPQTDSPE